MMCKCNSAEKEVGDVTNILNSWWFFNFYGLQEHLLKGAAGTEIIRIFGLIQSLLSAVTNKNIDFLGALGWSNLNDPYNDAKTLISPFESHITVLKFILNF